MEEREEEARRTLDRAQRKILESDYYGARNLVNFARSLYPNLEGLNQVLLMINVFISASNNGVWGPSWYGILGVDPSADEEAVKKQYKKLALSLHPDKNKFSGAEEAFKLVSEAWCVLSDEVKRSAYDEKRKFEMQIQQKHGSSRSQRANASTSTEPVYVVICDARCGYVTEFNLNKATFCPNCGCSVRFTMQNPQKPEASTKPASGMQRPTNPQKPASTSNKPPPPPAPAGDMSWTTCITCKVKFGYVKEGNSVQCPNCGYHILFRPSFLGVRR